MAFIFSGLLGQMRAISNPEGLGLVCSCGQCIGQALLPAGLQQGKEKESVMLPCSCEEASLFQEIWNEKSCADNNNSAMSNLRKTAFCGAWRSVFACYVKCGTLRILHETLVNIFPSLFYPLLSLSEVWGSKPSICLNISCKGSVCLLCLPLAERGRSLPSSIPPTCL